MPKAAEREIIMIPEGEIDRQSLVELIARHITGGDYAGYLARISQAQSEDKAS